MTRVKRGVMTHKRHKNILALAKGFRRMNGNVYSRAKNAIMNCTNQKKNKLLFYNFSRPEVKFEIDTNKYADWRPYKAVKGKAWPLKKGIIQYGWKNGRVS